MSEAPLFVTCTAPVNIAVIKYWGKRHESLILPVNSSLSGTLDQASLRTTTTVMASKTLFTNDELILNGEQHPITGRLLRVFAEMRQRAGDVTVGDRVLVKKEDWPQYKIRVCSKNNFPTAAGLASSASGFACLVFALAQLMNVRETYKGELSAVARMGSGSACRSLYGGFVKWVKGERDDGSDSYAVQVAPASHWPEIEVVILVASDAKKLVPSRAGMQSTVETSELMAARIGVADRRCREMEEAILAKDYDKFVELTIKDSNQFHAVCLDTYPPIFYLNDTSRRVIRLATVFNEMMPSSKVAYTFDAGPNAVLYGPAANLKAFMKWVMHYFPPTAANVAGYVDADGLAFLGASSPADLLAATELPSSVTDAVKLDPLVDGLKRVIHCKLGEGPQVLPPSASLMNTATGEPL